ncbi:MAG: sensor histidine kinase [Synechococcus sp.]
MSATVAVVGATGGFATWTMYREIFSSTKVQQEDTLTRLFQDVNTYQEMLTPAEALERGGDKYSDLDTWVQVEDRQGDILFQSETLNGYESYASFMPPSPELIRNNGQSWIACGQWLTMNDGSEVFVSIIDDITPSDRAYWGFIRTLSISGLVAVTAATVIGMALIRRSLSPLRKLSRVTDTISIDSLEESRLSLMDAPEEVEQLVVALNQMIDRLAGAWETEQQLLGDISHELRTPLAIVQGYLESTLRRGQNLTEMQRESLTTALDETQGTVRLLQEMMNLARAESCGRKMTTDAIEMGEFAGEIEGLASQIVSNPFELELPARPVKAIACRHSLKQVMLNLITNAGRYSESDSPIVLRVSSSESEVIVDIQDSGIGISPEQLPRIFDRFYRADGSRNRAKGGVGLGLSIATVLMEQMRGSIAVDSKVGEGSTFTLHLPKASPQSSDVETKQLTATNPPLSRV